MRRREERGERGAATAFVVGMAVTLVVVAGLVVDGGGALNARMALADDVEQAARAGAQATDIDRLRQDQVLVVNIAEARARATQYLASRGYHGIRVSATQEGVTVSAKDTVQTKMLLLIDIDTFEVSATATSEAETAP